MKAVGYVRVSSLEQVESGLSLEAQRAKIEAYATFKGLELVAVIEDAGLSARNLSRPGVQRALAMAHAGEVEALIVLKLDRLFRSTLDALSTCQSLDKRGVALHSISENLDTKTPMGKFFFTLLAGLGEMERGLIAERTKTALAQKKKRGEKTGGGVPYGYQAVDGRLVGNAEEQKIKGRIARLRASGLSYRAIADQLNEAGVTAKQGGRWTATQVSRACGQQSCLERVKEL